MPSRTTVYALLTLGLATLATASPLLFSDNVGGFYKRDIPEEQPVQQPGGVIIPYNKRQIIPVESPVQGLAPGHIEPYGRRQTPDEEPVKSLNGNIEPYGKRQTVPVEVPVGAPNGGIEPYSKRQIPAEQASSAPNGEIEPYGKRQIPDEQPVQAPNTGGIVPFKRTI
ncbi:uncharacterized protein C8R40DRAFT_1165728 [Lentinula edodes]|uniref:uncharacterized protein n=1 Tax=Lentinula edodes TaxID=5353 RepID=UPI001E8E19D8|nr:uncharacterized protein C8R40DRAFT_1165728 [Lentinula edodes]KAH7880804.1 hypothetical protein C8R40DRAFT_1165728 [Lentinula edodes]